MQIVTNTVGGCRMRVVLASAPVTLGIINNEKIVLKILRDLADGKRPPRAEARKFLKQIGFYKLIEEEKRLAALIKNNPGIEERERREEEEYNRNSID